MNPYFEFYKHDGEQDFYADFVDEQLKLAGAECLYIPKDMADIDSILGEPYQAIHERYYPVALVLTDQSGYEGEDIMSKFGLAMGARAEWVMSKRLFQQLEIPNREQRPLEGDLIFIGWRESVPQDPAYSNHLFEITYVQKDKINWPLGRNYVWQLTTELYTHHTEKFDTGLPDIDNINDRESNQANVDKGINQGLIDEIPELIDFEESNPFGNL